VRAADKARARRLIGIDRRQQYIRRPRPAWHGRQGAKPCRIDYSLHPQEPVERGWIWWRETLRHRAWRALEGNRSHVTDPWAFNVFSIPAGGGCSSPVRGLMVVSTIKPHRVGRVLGRCGRFVGAEYSCAGCGARPKSNGTKVRHRGRSNSLANDTWQTNKIAISDQGRRGSIIHFADRGASPFDMDREKLTLWWPMGDGRITHRPRKKGEPRRGRQTAIPVMNPIQWTGGGLRPSRLPEDCPKASPG